MFKNYIKIALRNLWRRRGFSLINISGLAIGLTAGFLILLYVNFELSYDRFHTKSDNIYRVVADLKTPSDHLQLSQPAWAVAPHLEEQFSEIESAVRILNMNMLVRNDEIKFKESNAIAADPAFFEVFDFKLLQGDLNTVIKEPYSIVLSKTTAHKYFGDENPIGQSLKITEDGYITKITGVMEDIPENSHIRADMVLSLTTFTEDLDKELNTAWGNYDPAAYILVNSNVKKEQLEPKFEGFLERNCGEEMREFQMFATLFLEPFEDVYLHSTRGGKGDGNINNIYIFSIVALFILLIASINFINLTTARSVERAKEVGVRKVIGAEKGQLALQFVGESIIISIIAFIVSIVLSVVFLPLFNAAAGKIISSGVFSSGINILILFSISLSIGILAGLYPAFVLSSFRPVSVLKGNFSTGTQGTILRKGLVTTQFTISIALIIGTIIIYNQTNFMRNQELGFSKEQLLILETNASPKQLAFQNAIEKLPGVKSTSLGSSVPGGGNSNAYSEIENKAGELQAANLALYFVDYDYISQFELELAAGRGFSKEFATDSTEAMVINEETAKIMGYSNPEEAIGAKFKQWGREGQVIGVIKDFHFRSLQQNISPMTMRIESDRNDLIAVKIAGQNIKQTIASIESQWSSILPTEPFDYYFLDEFFDEQYRTEERFGDLFLNFAILAILISCLGLLGLAAYSTLQRKREIGVRKVLGASVTEVVRLLSKDFLKLVVIAFLIASPIAWFIMDYWLSDFAYRITIQWWMFGLAGVLAIVIALLTVSFHAIKASVVNPVKSLRTE
ncbi:ABC transporter permease [Aquimarina aggregata]|uniref:ABC transporter permease n=1 Tax=Aquimarina aggregata TaxID=1642818 RepID=UPI0024928E3A|nr:ABC transporter permease [Aquimarina aggregata]